jgi:hypothetical protein
MRSLELAVGGLSGTVGELARTVGDLARTLAGQEEFQRRALCEFERIEAGTLRELERIEAGLLRRLDGIETSLAESGRGEFQTCVFRGLDRIEAVLAESLPHDMFEGYARIRGLVDGMTEMYGLSGAVRRRYMRELCRVHGIPLPDRALAEGESPFLRLREVAERAGLLSPNGRPHSRLAAALLRRLGLDRGGFVRKAAGAANPEYSEDVVPRILEWLQERGWPETIALPESEGERARCFRVKYRPAE